jgi:hypothetical protein
VNLQELLLDCARELCVFKKIPETVKFKVLNLCGIAVFMSFKWVMGYFVKVTAANVK